jgi:hypothetical protein
MDARALRKQAAIAGIILAMGTAPAWAGQSKAPAAQRPADLWTRTHAWLGELLAVVGIVPSGHNSSSSGEEGPMIDPDGVRFTSQTRCTAVRKGCGGEASGDRAR